MRMDFRVEQKCRCLQVKRERESKKIFKQTISSTKEQHFPNYFTLSGIFLRTRCSFCFRLAACLFPIPRTENWKWNLLFLQFHLIEFCVNSTKEWHETTKNSQQTRPEMDLQAMWERYSWKHSASSPVERAVISFSLTLNSWSGSTAYNQTLWMEIKTNHYLCKFTYQPFFV
jgi:hypothetical protein